MGFENTLKKSYLFLEMISSFFVNFNFLNELI